MISDRSIGALLSGGIDSSTIAALMQKNSLKKLKHFLSASMIKNLMRPSMLV